VQAIDSISLSDFDEFKRQIEARINLLKGEFSAFEKKDSPAVASNINPVFESS
jgi:hypothetical protein